MRVFSRLIIFLYQSRVYNFIKKFLLVILSEDRFNNLKNFIKKKFVKVNNEIYKREEIGKISNISEVGINIAGFFTSGLGLGEAARNIVRAIESQNIRYVMNDYVINKQRKVINDFLTNIANKNPYFFNLICINPDYLDFFYAKAGRKYFEGKYNIGLWYWELSNFPEEWLKYFNLFNEIWVATDFVLSSISFLSPIPVVKIPTVVELECDNHKRKRDFHIKDDTFVFLYIFDFLSSVDRKNPIAVVKSFKRAFKNDDKAMLIIKSSNGKNMKKEYFKLLTEIEDSKNILLIDRYLERKDLNSLINLSDCYVSLHRSEGFGLGIAEAMYLGKPVIVTGYSGNMDFTNVNNSFLVEYELVDLKENFENYKYYKKGNVWAEPNINHAAELMRFVFENRDYAKTIGKKGEYFVKKYYNPIIIGEKIKKRLHLILNDF